MGSETKKVLKSTELANCFLASNDGIKSTPQDWFCFKMRTFTECLWYEKRIIDGRN